MDFDVTEFLEDLYALTAIDNSQGATDHVFNAIDRLCHEGEFKIIDSILDNLDVSKTPSYLLRGCLCITYAAKEKLERRTKFYDVAYDAIVDRRGFPVADRLLSRLV